MSMAPQPSIERCRCGGTAVVERVQVDRARVRCELCGAVEMHCHFPHVAIDMWNESQLMHRLAKTGEGAGDKLREDVP